MGASEPVQANFVWAINPLGAQLKAVTTPVQEFTTLLDIEKEKVCPGAALFNSVVNWVLNVPFEG